jgi:threonine synthase
LGAAIRYFAVLCGTEEALQHDIKRPSPESGDSISQPRPDFELAQAAWSAVPAEAAALQRIAADSDCTLLERVEAFDDLIDAEVGDTDLTRARNIERETNLRQLFVKFEGGNPSGTQKDRIAFAQAKDALRRGFDCMTLATCGNYGAAAALASSMAGIRCVIYIPEQYQARRMQEMLRYNAEVTRVSGGYEAAVEAASKAATKNDWYDANPGGDNTALQLAAYGDIAREIYDDMRDAPAAVAVPVSNGTLLAGIYRGFESLYRRGKTSRMPHMVAGSTYKQNPIIAAFLSGADECADLDPAQIRETGINEPLVNWHAIDGDLALAGIRASGGWADYASDRALSRYSRLLRDTQGLSVLPASTAGLHGLLTWHAKQPLPGDRYVAILTGRKT